MVFRIPRQNDRASVEIGQRRFGEPVMRDIGMRTLAVGAIVLSMSCVGCTDAEVSRVMSYGDPQHVRFYSGGVLVGEWTSTGQVLNDGQSDGYVFTDSATGQLVRVSGEVIITLVKPASPGATLPQNPIRR